MSDLTLTNGECEDQHGRDVPLHPGDRDLPLAALQAKLTAWLSRHDQETSHLTSILPLAVGMPIRLTENVDRESDSFCKICNLLDKWVGTLKLNSHGCSACQKIFDNSEWPKYMLRNHLRFNRKLICSACRADGFTTHCTDGRVCTICEKKRGAGKFNKYASWNQSRRNSELICDDCIDKKRCDGAKCDAILNKSAVSAREWKYKQTHPDSYLLCSNCRAKGFSKKDNKLYQCTSCKEMLGCKCFDTDELYRMKRSK